MRTPSASSSDAAGDPGVPVMRATANECPADVEHVADEAERAAVERKRRVMEHAFSRNRHFDWYEDQDQDVRSFRRIVQGLVSGLEYADPGTRIQVSRDRDTARFRLSLDMRRFRATHTCYLDEWEVEAIRSHPELGERLCFGEHASD